VRAPITGIVATRSIEVGQTLIGGTATSGASVFTLADVTPLLASVSVDETDIAKIRRGMAATVTADALPDAQFVGVVTRIAASGVVSNNVNQYTVVVQLTNPSAALKLGMTVDASFVVQAAHDTLLVPTEAIHSQGNMQFVTVVGSDGRLSARQVTTGISDDRNTAITTGLREGERVYLGQASGTPSRPATRNPFMPNMPRPSGSGSTGAR
jgi:RND family efflux transporter MFP subunit